MTTTYDVRRRRRRLSCVPLSSSSFLLSSLFFSLDFLEERKKERNPVKNEEVYATLIIHILFLASIGGGVTREKAKKKIGFPQFVHARARPREGKRKKERKKGRENRRRATPGFEKKSRTRRRRRRPPPPPPLLI